MQYGSSDSIYGDIKKGFRNAENIVYLLHKRVEEDGEEMQFGRNRMQTVGDLQEFATNGIEGLCKRIGVPKDKMGYIAQDNMVKLWLEYVVLRKLLFSLLIFGQGREAGNLASALASRVGKVCFDEIATSTFSLARDFKEVVRAQDTNRMIEIMGQTLVAANSKIEEYHQQFIR